MNPPAAPGPSPGEPSFAVALALFWLAGVAMRLPLLVVPPVIPLIHDDLHMSETQVGALAGMPLTMFALAAIPGSLLIARTGVMPVAVFGFTLTALASAARAAAIDVWTLYAATVLLGLGIAVLQPTMPTLVRAWTPARMWLANSVYTNGLTIGVALGPALTIPLVLPLVGGSWRRDLLVWSIPCLIAALAFVAVAPRGRAAPAAAAPRRWWPDWNNPLIWLLGITLGANNAQFYAINTFTPEYLTSTGHADMIGVTLGWLNGSQLAASFLVLAIAEKLKGKSWPFTTFGPLTVLSLGGILFGDGVWVVLAAAVFGLASSFTFLIIFGLPAIVGEPGDVHRLAGGMFTISYTLAVFTPIVCGALWDVTGLPWTSFVPIAVGGIILTIFGTLLTARRP